MMRMGTRMFEEIIPGLTLIFLAMCNIVANM